MTRPLGLTGYRVPSLGPEQGPETPQVSATLRKPGNGGPEPESLASHWGFLSALLHTWVSRVP